MTNPYEAPNQPTATASKKKRKKRGVMDVITGQKLLICSILFFFGIVLMLVALNVYMLRYVPQNRGLGLFSLLKVVGLIAAAASAIMAAVGIFRIGGVLFPGTARYIYTVGVLIPVPFVSLIVMLVANSKATTYLRNRGVSVGFFGAKR